MFVVAAFGAYFMSEYGAIMNQEMMRNVLQTDRAEVDALMNGDLGLHVALTRSTARVAGVAGSFAGNELARSTRPTRNRRSSRRSA